jgi:hypothetical protein
MFHVSTNIEVIYFYYLKHIFEKTLQNSIGKLKIHGENMKIFKIRSNRKKNRVLKFVLYEIF